MFKDYYIGVSYTNNLQKINLNKEMDEYAQKHGIRCLPIHQCKYLTNQDVIIYEALTAIAGHPIKISDYEDYSFEINPLEDERINEFVNSINLNLFNDKIEKERHSAMKICCHRADFRTWEAGGEEGRMPVRTERRPPDHGIDSAPGPKGGLARTERRPSGWG